MDYLPDTGRTDLGRRFWIFCGDFVMAKRFGGKYSAPESSKTAKPDLEVPNKFRGRKVHQGNLRATLLFFIPLPLLFSGIGELRAGDAIGMLAELGALALLLLAAWLLRDGLKAEAAYAARKVSRAPALPRKMLASALTGLGVALAAFVGWQQGAIASVIFGLLAAGAHSFSFGIDPLRKKGMTGFSEFDAERVARAVEKAEILLTETLDAAKRIPDRGIEGRVETLASTAREMFRVVEDDPRDLTAARKFLSVYLMGARDATIKFADIYSRRKDANARRDYEALLTDLERSFKAQREVLLRDDLSDLDVEIDVLRDRLKREGLTADNA
jgi:5-bromo-4-chloroindolyl phosphate hydrolysis protein